MISGLDDTDKNEEKKIPDILSTLLQSDNLFEEGDIEELPLTLDEFQAKSKEIYSKKFENKPNA